ncbi:hypothetical protein [Variovorax guangxiensis]|uniref:Single-stranded DNA-binding protein n=1 Tax=Variovorax guangxiensis TaxID=1775474 RepID=A0A840FZB8_9BURK|nr:hypothetical protein [Variovorax guangxiensis]MBB4225604.1 hypothetical protein [Variovorax guangxiensis]
MKVTVIGVERLEGIGKESKKPFAIGKVFAAVKLESSRSETGLTKGSMGTEYRVEPELVKRIEHLDFPVDAELIVEDVMIFGKRETKVLDVRPIGRAAAPVKPLQQAA